MKKTIIFAVALFMIFSFAVAASAQNIKTSGSTCTGDLCLQNPLGDVSTPQALIGRVLNSVFGVVGSIALLMFVYGGLVWMTSSGNADKVKKGRDILIWSAIGLVVIFSAYALVRVVISTIAA